MEEIEIQRVIWYNRSSLNLRKGYEFYEKEIHNDNYIHIWKAIEKYVSNYSLFILNNLKLSD